MVCGWRHRVWCARYRVRSQCQSEWNQGHPIWRMGHGARGNRSV